MDTTARQPRRRRAKTRYPHTWLYGAFTPDETQDAEDWQPYCGTCGAPIAHGWLVKSVRSRGRFMCSDCCSELLETLVRTKPTQGET